jgi:hypothetical protein
MPGPKNRREFIYDRIRENVYRLDVLRTTYIYKGQCPSRNVYHHELALALKGHPLDQGRHFAQVYLRF